MEAKPNTHRIQRTGHCQLDQGKQTANESKLHSQYSVLQHVNKPTSNGMSILLLEKELIIFTLSSLHIVHQRDMNVKYDRSLFLCTFSSDISPV